MTFLVQKYSVFPTFNCISRIVLASFINYLLSQLLYQPYLINYANEVELLIGAFFPNFARIENGKLRKLRQLLPPHHEPIPIICHTIAVFIALWLMNGKNVNTNSIIKIIKMGLCLAFGNVIWTLNAQRISEQHFFFILTNLLHSFMTTMTITRIMFVKIIPREKIE